MLLSHTDELFLEEIQKDLLIVGGYFADEEAVTLGISTDNISKLEERIDLLVSQLEPLKGFILPNGSNAAGLCHVCRVICRRAERRMISLRNSIGVEMDGIPFVFINRLSDYFFVLARIENLK